eukprot:scaffold23175_cov115-Isochrysis_galbana.AAC.2
MAPGSSARSASTSNQSSMDVGSDLSRETRSLAALRAALGQPRCDRLTACRWSAWKNGRFAGRAS